MLPGRAAVEHSQSRTDLLLASVEHSRSVARDINLEATAVFRRRGRAADLGERKDARRGEGLRF